MLESWFNKAKKALNPKKGLNGNRNRSNGRYSEDDGYYPLDAEDATSHDCRPSRNYSDSDGGSSGGSSGGDSGND